MALNPAGAEHRIGSEAAGALSLDQLTVAADAIRKRISELEGRLAELDRALDAARQEENLLQHLIDLRSGTDRAESISAEGDPQASADRGGAHPAVEAVITALAESRKPVHVSELMRVLAQSAVRLPGAGRQANLISHMRRDARIVRPSRGMYALREWGLEDMVSAAGPGRGKRRKRGSRPPVRRSTSS
jgi:hypothetical protein